MACAEPVSGRVAVGSSRPWLAWLLAGTTDQATTTMRRKVMQVNLGACGIVLTILGFLCFYLWQGNEALVRAGLSQLPFALLAPVVWRLNARGQVQAARWWAFGVAMGGTLAAIAGGLGTVVGAHVYFLLFAVLTVMFYPLAEWRAAMLVAVVNTASFFWLESQGWPAHPQLAELPEPTLRGIRYALISGCIAVTIVLSALSEWAADLNEQRLHVLADTDGLTGLLNRRAMTVVLTQELSRAERSGEPLALGLVDADHFKAVNDAWGHETGDDMLRHLASLLVEGTRAYDQVGRVGGEEFLVLMPAVDLAQAVASMERLRDTVAARPLSHKGQRIALTISVGVAAGAAGRSAEDLLREADQALYRAKREGRNRVCLAR